MYDGFSDDLRRATDGGEGEVARFIHDTARTQGVPSWEVFEAAARQRIAWQRGERDPEQRPRRRRRGRRATARAAAGSIGRLWGYRRRPRALVARAGRAAAARAWKATRRGVTWARTKGRKAAVRAARQAKRAAKRLSRTVGTTARRWGKLAFPLVYRLWTGKQLPGKPSWPLIYKLWTGKTWKPRRRPKVVRREVPAPGPALAAYLAGETERAATYMVPDPAIRDARDDWPGALDDFRTSNRTYIAKLQELLAEEPST